MAFSDDVGGSGIGEGAPSLETRLEEPEALGLGNALHSSLQPRYTTRPTIAEGSCTVQFLSSVSMPPDNIRARA